MLPRLTPRRKIGSPQGEVIETAGRDAALDNLAAYRGALCEAGREIAIELCRTRGRITSVEVFAEMRARGYDEALDSSDPRWMGVVFREEIWRRQGWEQTGSHRRPVAVWELRDANNIPASPRAVVYQTVAAAKERGVTDEEVMVATGLAESSVRTQLDALHEADLILKTGQRRRRCSGRKAAVYVLPTFHPEIL